MRYNLVNSFLILSILSGVIPACRAPDRPESSIEIERTDSCRSNPAHAYEVFIPARNKPDIPLPLLVAIDPHGDGKLAITHLKEAASKYPAVLVASDLIQNNDPDYVHELDELIADAKSRYPVGDRTFLAGFSGGARMALAYAANHALDGIIAAGAFAGPGQLSAIKCPVMGLIGMDDFNFIETAQFILNPGSLPSGAHIELTKASHEWPEKKRLTSVFGWFQVGENPDKRYGHQQVNQYVKEQEARIDSLTAAGELLQAACIGRNMASVVTFEKAGSFRSVPDELTKKEALRQQLSKLAESLRFEMKQRQVYGPALMEKKEAWWKKEIQALHEKMTSEPDEMTRMAYKRLSGFIGIACYSYAQKFAAQKDIPHLEQILMVYRLAEPDNPDMKHFTELLRKLKTHP